MEPRELITNSLTKHLRDERGMTLLGWARINLCNPNMTRHVVYKGVFEPSIIAKLRAQGLYKYLTPEVKGKIEEREKREGNGNA